MLSTITNISWVKFKFKMGEIKGGKATNRWDIKTHYYDNVWNGLLKRPATVLVIVAVKKKFVGIDARCFNLQKQT